MSIQGRDGPDTLERLAPASPGGEPTAPTPAGPAAAPPPRRGRRLHRLLLPIGLMVVAVLAWVGFNLYWNELHYVTTDNAQVTGQLIPVGSMNAGRVVALRVMVGQAVRKDEVLAEVELPSQVGMAQNGTPKLDFLGSADTRVQVRSPIDGVVAAVQGAEGATVAQGQPLVLLVDPSQLWVNANVDETKVARLQIGQEAEVHIDVLNATVPGRVEALTPATAATFSLLPQANNTTVNFTRVAQVVPVRIAVHLGNSPGLLGSSATVRIRVA